MTVRHVGARLKRPDDPRLLTGRGRYVDDLTLPRMAHVAFVRSPHAHAVIAGIECDAARRDPGVLAVLTGADAARLCKPYRGVLLHYAGMKTGAMLPLATDRARYVGEPVVAVAAGSRALAEDACELVEVAYEPLPALADVDHALAPDAPAIFDEVGGNLMFEGHWTYGDPDAGFTSAARTKRWRFTQHRLCNAPLEGRAGLVDHDPDTGDLTYHAAHQNPHAIRLWIAELLGMPAHRFHVRTD
ncbi:MAG TPA: molybdopterin cofactor-binding domain-containing protein, partial [Methylomirabilota bacterium]|nr:molybdopterin cofactor-binding domain-containing protein [Methylomirabilota bacterium]